MNLKTGLLVLLTILGFSNTWTVEASRHRRTTKPPLSENTTSAVVEVNETDKKYHHKPQNSPQIPPEDLPQNPLQYPPPYLPQNPPQHVPPNPLDNSPQIIPEYPPHFPPQELPQVTPQNPPQYPHQNLQQIAQQYPPNYSPPHLPQTPPQVTLQKPLQNLPKLPLQYPPQHLSLIIQPHPAQSRPQYLPQNPPQILPPSPPHYQPHNPPHNPPQNPPSILKPIPPKVATILDQFDNRFSDGSYEFRYALSDDSVRYERGYFIYYQQTKILVVKGYYSHQLPDRRYLTVFYAADQYGNRQNTYFTSYRPQLPRSLNTETGSIEEIIRSSEVDDSTSKD